METSLASYCDTHRAPPERFIPSMEYFCKYISRVEQKGPMAFAMGAENVLTNSVLHLTRHLVSFGMFTLLELTELTRSLIRIVDYDRVMPEASRAPDAPLLNGHSNSSAKNKPTGLDGTELFRNERDSDGCNWRPYVCDGVFIWVRHVAKSTQSTKRNS